MNTATETAKRIEVEPFQRRAVSALQGPASNVLVYGGSGSGKTHTLLTWVVLRALSQPQATHAIFRLHFAHLQGTIIDATLPAVCQKISPGTELYKLDRTAGNYHARFIGGGRIYFGGLSDKDQTEKILGSEYSTIYLNETSQISYAAFVKAQTRLRQSAGLPLKLICDENPPLEGHWTHRMWIKGVSPETNKPLVDRHLFASLMMHPRDNPHIPEVYKRVLQNLSPRDRLRFWEGLFGQVGAGQLWTYDGIENATIEAIPAGVTIVRVVVAVDPSGCHGPEDKRSDEVGIVVLALGSDGVVYVLEDASGRLGPDGEQGWGARIIDRVVAHGADCVYGETNFGGAMVGAVLRTAKCQVGERVHEGWEVAFREITASRGKAIRAEPVSTLTGRGRVKFVEKVPGQFNDLRDQLVKFYTSGYTGEKSPDRADAFVHGAYALGVVSLPGQGAFALYEQEFGGPTTGSPVPSVPMLQARDWAAETPSALVPLVDRMGRAGTFYTRKGRGYCTEAGRVLVAADDVEDLLAIGFERANPA